MIKIDGFDKKNYKYWIIFSIALNSVQKLNILIPVDTVISVLFSS